MLVAFVGIAALSAIWGFALGTVFHAVHLTVELALLLTALLGGLRFFCLSLVIDEDGCS